MSLSRRFARARTAGGSDAWPDNAESASPPGSAPLLEAQRMSAGYGALPVVHDIDLVVRPGQIVALLGPNGAGKTTTLLALSGELPVMSGTVRLDGVPTKEPLHHRARRGLAFVPEERSVFKELSCRDNLRVGRGSTEEALEFFPDLSKRLEVRGGLLSGGEQQMLTLARALAGEASGLVGRRAVTRPGAPHRRASPLRGA